jgi:hypothetical protein
MRKAEDSNPSARLPISLLFPNISLNAKTASPVALSNMDLQNTDFCEFFGRDF